MAKLTVKDLELKDKKVLLRCDFNVPQDENLNITDDTQIRASLATIKYILSQSPKKLILISHLGRPDGKARQTARAQRACRLARPWCQGGGNRP